MSTRDSVALWLLWQRAFELTRTTVLRDVTTAIDVGESELVVLIRLSKAGGVLRQNALGAALGWDRTRVSHLLTRMTTRSLVTRRRLRSGVEISLSDSGRGLLEAALPHLVEVTRLKLADRLRSDDTDSLAEVDAFARMLERLVAADDAAPTGAPEEGVGTR